MQPPLRADRGGKGATLDKLKKQDDGRCAARKWNILLENLDRGCMVVFLEALT